MTPDFDIAIVGSSFAASLLAMIASRLGKRVLMIERHRHPRFAIGESSTPLANLLLEELAIRYDLPRLLPLTQWGAWQRTYPKIGCGLKRGFSFYFHSPSQIWTPRESHDNELLVAASPNDEVADTHWYRPDFDAWFVEETQRMGVVYVDETRLEAPEISQQGVVLSGIVKGIPFRASARWLVDASGAGGFLRQHLKLRSRRLPALAGIGGVFSHWKDVERWGTLHPYNDPLLPYPPDDAALHHIVGGGWMWVLRFNNGITSAGFTAASDSFSANPMETWTRWLSKYPSVAKMFDSAKPLQPWVQTKCFSFCTEQVVSDCWLLLPGTTGFVDPLLSTGFVLNLLGIERLGRWMEGGMSVDELKQYEWDTIADLRVTEAIVSGLYRCMKPMGMGPSESRKFSALTMLYFAAASFSETVRRLGKPELARGFLLRGNVEFHSRMTSILMDIDQDNADRIDSRVRELIEPFNIAGLLNLKRKNWYPVDLDALRQSGVKVSSSELEIASMLGKSLGVGIDPGR